METGIKVAIGGKGGVGKTTICAVLARIFAQEGFEVLAVDADPNANLCSAFGIPSVKSPQPLINMKQLIAERTGTDSSATGKDSVAAYFRLNPKVSDLPEKYALEIDGLKLLILGGIKHGGSGCACPEGAFLRAMLSHMILMRREVILLDMAAGVEFMGRASIEGIDAMVVVVEPGSRSIETAINIARMAKELGIGQVAAIANKITDAGQIETIKSQLAPMPVISNIEYKSQIQQADLGCESVYESSAYLVEQLREAKKELINLIYADVNPNVSSD